jgi:5-methylthioadenosine/S-adenosylhomocysteine deaminase
LRQPDIEILRHKHYHQHDVYFHFADPGQGHLRYREDELIDARGEIQSVRARLTLIGPAREADLGQQVILSRVRYFAPATNSLRFYREYFKPTGETPIDKDRLRWLIRCQGTEFYVNLDRLENPPLGYYLEIKSRTWSRKDAERKAQLAIRLLGLLGGSPQEAIRQDYIELIEGKSA